jgi:cell division protein ZapA (FtsZ GTPase activity inhibitor)
MRTYKITVAGQSFEVKSDANEEHLLGLAKVVEERFKQLKKGNPRGDQDFLVMSMVAVSILDELRSSQEKLKATVATSRQFADALIDKIDELLVREID